MTKQKGVLMTQVAAQIDTEENALAKRVLSHCHREFGSIPVFDEPFQHFYSDRVWPADVYEAMLRLLPPDHVYRPMNIKGGFPRATDVSYLRSSNRWIASALVFGVRSGSL
jgi:hypothetical protein